MSKHKKRISAVFSMNGLKSASTPSTPSTPVTPSTPGKEKSFVSSLKSEKEKEIENQAKKIKLEPIIHREWIPIENKKTKIKIDSDLSFRLVTQNVMTQRYVNVGRHQYDWCPLVYIKDSYRKRKMLDQIIHYNADISCLQELSYRNFKFLKEELKDTHLGNYKQITKLDPWKKPQPGEKKVKLQKGKEGVAIFFKKESFELVKSYEIEFNNDAHEEFGGLGEVLKIKRSEQREREKKIDKLLEKIKPIKGLYNEKKVKIEFTRKHLKFGDVSLLFQEISEVTILDKEKTSTINIEQMFNSGTLECFKIYKIEMGNTITDSYMKKTFVNTLIKMLEIDQERDAYFSLQESGSVKITSEKKKRFFSQVCLKSHNVALCSVLQHKASEKQIAIATLHGDFQRERTASQVYQKEMLLKRVGDILYNHGIKDVIICGDFNIKENSCVYDFIVNGFIDDGIEMKGDCFKVLQRMPTHDFSLKQAYTSDIKPFTHYHSENGQTSSIDYIFYDELNLLNVLEIPEKDLVCPFPNKNIYSDHLMIGAEFSFKSD